MIEWLVVGAAALTAGVYCARPLRRGVTRQGSPVSSPSEAELRRDSALAGLDDLEFDRDAGKLEVEDFSRLRAQFEAEAVAAMDELEERVSADSHPEADDPLEVEIAAARRALACPNCGSPRQADERCPRCGA